MQISVFIILSLLSGTLLGQNIDLRRAAATCVQSGAANLPQSRSFGGAKPGLEMRAVFSAEGSGRACWDFSLPQDLSQMAAVRLRFRCVNASLASQFNLYIQVENNWYAAPFAPGKNGSWEEIIVPKSSFLPEGASGSWQQCRKLRLAAWRGSPGVLLWQIAELELLPPNINLALLRSGGNTDQQRESYSYARYLGDCLFQGGLYPAVLEEADCAPRVLYPYQMLLLPYPAASSPSLNNAVLAYLKNGGKVGLFYSHSPVLAASMGLPAGKFCKSLSLAQPLAGIQPEKRLLPQAKAFRQQSGAFMAVKNTGRLQTTAWWLDAAGKNTGWPAMLEAPSGFWLTHVFLNQDSEGGFCTLLAQMERFLPGLAKAAAAATLNRAKFAYHNHSREQRPAGEALAQAENAYRQQNFHLSREAAVGCLNLLHDADIPKAPARQNEFRAVWCRRTTGLPGQTWAQTARTLADAGFGAIFPNLLTAWPDEQVLQQHLPDCLAAGRDNSLAVHLWFSCLGVSDLPPAKRQWFAERGLLQKKDDGTQLPWLCPTQPYNRQLLIAIATQVCQKYPVAGLHLDLIRFPGSQACFCASCQQAFEKILGRRLPNFPDAVRPGNPAYRQWQAFRCQQISSLVQEICQSARAARPGILLSAAVYPDWQSARDSVGQDWVNWQKQALLDFVCPMNYRATASLFAGDLARQTQQLGRPNALLPGIGVSSERLSKDELARQIQCCRNAGTPGFILFEFTPREAYDLLPGLLQKIESKSP